MDQPSLKPIESKMEVLCKRITDASDEKSILAALAELTEYLTLQRDKRATD